MPTWTTRIGWPPDLLEVSDLSSVALEELLDLAARMKAEPAGWTAALPGESLACVFEGPSARERVIAGAAAHRLGMLPVVLSAGELDDPAAVSEYATAVVAVGKEHDMLKRIAAQMSAPVVNGRSQEHHPCQALADLLTLREQVGALGDIAVAYVGDADTNIAQSLIEAGGRVLVTDDPRAALEGADAVYSAAWSHGDDALRPYRLDGRLMRFAKKEPSPCTACPRAVGQRPRPTSSPDAARS
jgi:ornithine carbamoyltransferase